jgi:hypothetical protein
MRKLKKVLKVKTLECTMYDRTLGKERTETVTFSEVEKQPSLPENCYLIDSMVTEEKEVTYEMDMETFVKHATPVTK